MSKPENFQCTECSTRYPETRKTCFYCGKTDTIKFVQMKRIKRPKKPYTGALNIRLK